MNELEIAKKLAAITGKPLSEYYSGTIPNESDKRPIVLDAHKAEPVPTTSDRNEEPVRGDISEEILKYQKMFAGSTITNGKILFGRQMTKKEYNKYTKGLTIEEYYGHPLMYKMYRAEGQLDPSFMTFPERFR